MEIVKLMGREESKQREKELIWEQPPDSGIYDPCGRIPVHNVDVLIHIPAKGLELEALFQAETLLGQAGLSFDTGYGHGGRDWNFDWSLKGAYVKFRKHVDDKEQKLRWYSYRLFQGYSGEPDFLSCSVIYDKYEDILILVNGMREKFEPVLIKKLALMGCEEVYATPDAVEGGPEPEQGPLIGYKLGEDSIRVAYIPDERY